MSNQAIAPITKREMVDLVVSKVKQFRDNREVHFPPDYSPENALKSAWLTILETEDRDKKAALSVCTQESIANAMLSMVIQGLNTDKKQGYFIVYGNKLQFQRSYFGTMAVCKRVCPDIADIVAQVVYEDDVFKYKLDPRTARKEITEHEQTLEAVDSKKVKAVYCLLIGQKDNVIKTEIMTFEQIKQAWKQSKMNPVTDKGDVKIGSTHEKFLEEMCKKTIINKVCKPVCQLG
jgi:recombination protein RecT